MVCLQTSTELKKQIYTKYVQNKTKETTFEDIDFSDFPSFIFKFNHFFSDKKDNLSGKVVIVEEILEFWP